MLYGDKAASFYIMTGDILNGEFPERAKKLVKEFINYYQNELLQMWEKGKYYKLKGIE